MEEEEEYIYREARTVLLHKNTVLDELKDVHNSMSHAFIDAISMVTRTQDEGVDSTDKWALWQVLGSLLRPLRWGMEQGARLGDCLRRVYDEMEELEVRLEQADRREWEATKQLRRTQNRLDAANEKLSSERVVSRWQRAVLAAQKRALWEGYPVTQEMTVVHLEACDVHGLFAVCPDETVSALGVLRNFLDAAVRRHRGIMEYTTSTGMRAVFATTQNAIAWSRDVQVGAMDLRWPERILESQQGNEVLNDEGCRVFRGIRVGIAMTRVGKSCVQRVHDMHGRAMYVGGHVMRLDRLVGCIGAGEVVFTNDLSATMQGMREWVSWAKGDIENYNKPRLVVYSALPIELIHRRPLVTHFTAKLSEAVEAHRRSFRGERPGTPNDIPLQQHSTDPVACATSLLIRLEHERDNALATVEHETAKAQDEVFDWFAKEVSEAIPLKSPAKHSPQRSKWFGSPASSTLSSPRQRRGSKTKATWIKKVTDAAGDAVDAGDLASALRGAMEKAFQKRQSASASVHPERDNPGSMFLEAPPAPEHRSSSSTLSASTLSCTVHQIGVGVQTESTAIEMLKYFGRESPEERYWRERVALRDELREEITEELLELAREELRVGVLTREVEAQTDTPPSNPLPDEPRGPPFRDRAKSAGLGRRLSSKRSKEGKTRPRGKSLGGSGEANSSPVFRTRTPSPHGDLDDEEEEFAHLGLSLHTISSGRLGASTVVLANESLVLPTPPGVATTDPDPFLAVLAEYAHLVWADLLVAVASLLTGLRGLRPPAPSPPPPPPPPESVSPSPASPPSKPPPPTVAIYDFSTRLANSTNIKVSKARSRILAARRGEGSPEDRGRAAAAVSTSTSAPAVPSLQQAPLLRLALGDIDGGTRPAHPEAHPVQNEVHLLTISDLPTDARSVLPSPLWHKRGPQQRSAPQRQTTRNRGKTQRQPTSSKTAPTQLGFREYVASIRGDPPPSSH